VLADHPPRNSSDRLAGLRSRALRLDDADAFVRVRPICASLCHGCHPVV